MTIKERKDAYKKIIADNAGIGFYERTKLRYRSFPGEADSNLQYILLEAGRRTQEFIYFVSDTDHAQHAEHAKEYALKFDCSPDKVGDHFRKSELDKYAIDKAAIIEACTETGKKKAQHFIGSLLDANQPNHIENVAIFKTRYKEVPDQIESDMIEAELQRKGYKSIPVQDKDYEKSLTANTAILNPFQLAAYKSLKELYELKWNCIGSAADDVVFEEFQKENVSIPNLNFKPKH
jgi:hypothetical protein